MQINSTLILMAVVLFSLFSSGTLFADQTVELSSLDLTKMKQGWGEPQINQAVTGKPMSIAGKKYTTGVGTHANGVMFIQLGDGGGRFRASVGVDDGAEKKGTVQFKVFGDGQKLFDSGVMTSGQKAKAIDVDLTGVKLLILVTRSGGDGISFDHADWAEAKLIFNGDAPKAVDVPVEPKVILTPKPGPGPKINGPALFGVRPGKPFIYRIPCTGKRPIRFEVSQLPKGLTVNTKTGIITGNAPQTPGTITVTFKAKNKHGHAEKLFRIVVGDTLALTPPMGWNSWYIHYNRVTENHMRGAADTMISSGMADYGYMYVNIDDCWMKKNGDKPYRDKRGQVLTNAKFPDMKGMVDYIHAKGLRAGTYISPGPWTCAGYVGSYQHEADDARQFADWGFDFLKYDWCSYSRVATGEGLARLQKPYQQMGDLLKKQDRDLVLNLCQYGMGDVWKWGGKVGGHCWRTTGDLGLAGRGGLPGFYGIGLSNAQHDQYAKPGQWNDPDYILIGWVGDARGMKEGKETTLTSNEQYSYMSMWSLMAAPLIFSGDMAKLDEFTLNILCNTEVIAVDQDELGKQGRILHKTDEQLIMAKPLADGSIAVGLFNLAEVEQTIKVKWSDLEISGTQVVHDLWRQKKIETANGSFTAKVGRHGVMFVKISPAKK